VIKADYYMKTGEWKEAIFQLNQALKLDLKKKEKGRYNFILAQLYLRQGANELAVEAFNRVVKSKPSSRMAFEAKISLLEFSDMNSEVVMQALSKMIKSASNMPYLDRIYYARGEIELKSGNRLEAIRDFTTSVTHSLDNNNQRALSGLTAARLFFEDGNYRLASCYYDSTLAVIDNNYPGYEEIFAKTNGLSVLVRNLNQIEKEDSLQRIALMSETERLGYINKFIAKITEEENQRLKEEQLQQNSANYFRGQQYRPGMGNQTNNSLWYFYNPVTAGLGKTEFQQIWGKRKLEDNWRRKNKISLNQMDQELGDNLNDLQQKDSQQSKASDPKTVEYYLHDLPLTDSLMRASHDRIKSALFATGRIYLNILKNEPLAIKAFDELNKRYPGSIYELPTWIELYKMNHETALYKERITGKYPESNYARFLVNPNFFKELEVRRQLIERKYSEAVTRYQEGDYPGAGRLASEVMTLQPDSLLLPQVKYMELIARGKNAPKEEFSKMLDNYLSDFPNSPAVPTVAKIRELILQNSLAELEKNIARLDSAAMSQTKNQPSLQKNDPFGGKYSYDEDLFHYFVISFPGNAKVDVNRLIFDIANFNIDYDTSFDFEIEEVRLNEQTKLVVVRSLPTKEEGLGYFGNILRQKAVFQSLKNIDYHHFVASSPNFRKLIEDQDLIEYLNFFVMNYSKNSSPKP
jgi:outer membrane protein assembly factor BamD (BamD/ComL family)